MKAYYLLVVLRDGNWSPQFGDYDKEVVRDEVEFCYDTEVTKILKVEDSQVAIDLAVGKLNALETAE